MYRKSGSVRKWLQFSQQGLISGDRLHSRAKIEEGTGWKKLNLLTESISGLNELKGKKRQEKGD